MSSTKQFAARPKTFDDAGAISYPPLMTTPYAIGPYFEAFIDSQLATGRYGSASEVLCAALRLLEDREKQYAALDKAIMQGIADVEAGRVFDADEVFDELEARYAAMEQAQKTA